MKLEDKIPMSKEEYDEGLAVIVKKFREGKMTEYSYYRALDHLNYQKKFGIQLCK